LDGTKNNKIRLHNFVLGECRKLARYVKNWTHLMIRKKMKRVQNGSNWHKWKDWIVYQRKENFLSTHHFLKTWNSDLKNWFKAKHYKRMWVFSHKRSHLLTHCEINFVISSITMYNMWCLLWHILYNHIDLQSDGNKLISLSASLLFQLELWNEIWLMCDNQYVHREFNLAN